MRHGIRLLILALALTFGAGVASAQENPLDWQEYRQKLFEWPFEELEFWIEEDGGNITQYSRVQEDRDTVVEHLKNMARAQEEIGNGYFVKGTSHQSSPVDRWQITVGKRQLMVIVNVYDEGGTTLLAIESDPIPVISGYFKRALFPYRIPGAEVPARIIEAVLQ